MERNIFNDKYPFAQLAITILISLTTLLILISVASYAGKFIFGAKVMDFNELENLTDPSYINVLKYYQIVQTFGLFLLPALLVARLFSGNAFSYLYLNSYSRLNRFLLVIIIMISALPLINLLAYLNQQIHFPSFMKSIEESFIEAEKLAEKQTLAFMATKSVKGLLLNIFMIGILAAVGEELLFRGVLQRIFTNMTRNIHWGILISSFIFSAVHMQFYGFFPRWLLGILFGYLLYWSGSMWVPVLAHFLNNTMAVLAYYLVNIGKLSKETVDSVGTPNELILSSVLALFIFSGSLYFFYRQNSLEKSGVNKL